MFLGETLCIVAFYASLGYSKLRKESIERSKFNPVIFWLPALCDMTGTSLMYVGLTLTYASIFQMLRGR
jgi:hypothetical protein